MELEPLIILESPKSVNFTAAVDKSGVSNKIFSGFKSLERGEKDSERKRKKGEERTCEQCQVHGGR